MELMGSAFERIGRRDVALAVVVSVLGLLLMYGNVQDEEINVSVLAVPLFLGVTVPLLWRRVAPLEALGATLAALWVHDLLFGTEAIRLRRRRARHLPARVRRRCPPRAA